MHSVNGNCVEYNIRGKCMADKTNPTLAVVLKYISCNTKLQSIKKFSDKYIEINFSLEEIYQSYKNVHSTAEDNATAKDTLAYSDEYRLSQQFGICTSIEP